MIPAKEHLRSGFTTGACAAAATRGALAALVQQRAVEAATIRLPGGQEVAFDLHACSFTAEEGRASVIKDAGDDPDVTHGAEVQARVTWSDVAGVHFRAGVGVGLVTRKGLPVPPGEPAINPGPRRLIAESVEQCLAGFGRAGSGVVVEISVPNGAELAKKTFNPRLGIVGGISILGTTGIVVPYSTAAWLASVVQGIDVARAQGIDDLVLTVGERGERLARVLVSRPEEAFVQMGPFFGDSLRHCARVGVKQVTLIAMIGKLAKFAAGNESVHSTNSAQDFAFLAQLAQEAGADVGLIEQIRQANTAQEVAGLVATAGLPRFPSLLCERAWKYATALTGEALKLDVYLTDQSGALAGQFPPLPALIGHVRI